MTSESLFRIFSAVLRTYNISMDILSTDFIKVNDFPFMRMSKLWSTLPSTLLKLFKVEATILLSSIAFLMLSIAYNNPVGLF